MVREVTKSTHWRSLPNSNCWIPLSPISALPQKFITLLLVGQNAQAVECGNGGGVLRCDAYRASCFCIGHPHIAMVEFTHQQRVGHNHEAPRATPRKGQRVAVLSTGHGVLEQITTQATPDCAQGDLHRTYQAINGNTWLTLSTGRWGSFE